MNLNPSDTSHGLLAFTGLYEAELTPLIARLAAKGGLLVDVGANFGYYSLLWCGLRPENRSLAFEASPQVINRLRENVALNRFADRITVVEAAVSDRSGFVTFDVGPGDQTGWGGIKLGPGDADHAQVRSVRLDEVVKDAEVALLKIDCEGADYLILKGAENLLREKKVKHVTYEENKPRMNLLGIEPGESASLLRGLGWHCEAIGADDTAIEYHAWV